jgi:hypothetical protein
MQFEYSPHAYASALLSIEQKRVLKLTLAMAATGRSNQLLLDRVKRILNLPVAQQYSNRLVPLLFSVAMIGFIAWSNPGNVIVRQILRIENPEPPAADKNSEVSQVAFVQPTTTATKKEKSHPKKKVLTLSIKNNASQEPITADVLSTLEQYEVAAVNSNMYAPTLIQAGYENMRDFSIADPATATTAPTPEQTFTPFVPSSSFSYHFVQDSTKPTVVAETVDEKAAKETLQKALKALDEVDWTALEKQLKASGEKVDIKKIQQELKKQLKDVDWKKVNVEAKLESLKEQTKLNEIRFYKELKATSDAQNGQMQEHFNNMQKKIIDDQLKCQQDTRKKELELKKYLETRKVVKVKKIVEI